MSKRAKILVADSDLNALSRIYLSLVHKDYKVEATDQARELVPRIERFKPRLVILQARMEGLTQELLEELAGRRIYLLLVGDGEPGGPMEGRRIERVIEPVDTTALDTQIRDLLMLV